MPAGKLLWEPDSAFARKTNVAAFMRWLERRGLAFRTYDELWNWSVEDLEGFWGSVWKYFDVAEADYPVLSERRMPGARWFEGSELNFAKQVFDRKKDGIALISKTERRAERSMTWQGLEKKTSSLAANLRGMGVGVGDRVAAFLPNAPEAVVAFLACASVGAIWSGLSTTWTPASFSACIFACAVPCLPSIMLLACENLIPAGAHAPATYATSGFVYKPSTIVAAASSS
jgi:acetoacetyl-CoA synthetase